MPITPVAGQQFTATSSAATITGTLPAAPTPGNLLVARVYTANGSAATWSIPGWTVVGGVSGTTAGLIAYRVVQAGDSATITGTNGNGAAQQRLQVREFSGALADQAGVLEQQGTATSPSTVTLTAGPTADAASTSYAVAALATAATLTGTAWTGGFAMALTQARLESAEKQLTATGPVSVTATWNETSRAVLTLAVFKAAAAPVRVDSDLRWAVRALARQNSDLRWAVRALARQNSDLRWAVRAAVQRVADLRWGVRQLARRDTDVRWAVRVPARTDAALQWAVRGLARRDVDVRWSTRAATRASTDLRWAVRRLAGVVVTDLRWAVRRLAGTAADLRWAARRTVRVDTDIRWRMPAETACLTVTVDPNELDVTVAPVAELTVTVEAC